MNTRKGKKIFANALLSDGELLAYCTCEKWMTPDDFIPQLRRAGIELKRYAGTHTLTVVTVSRDLALYDPQEFAKTLAIEWYEHFPISPDYRGLRPGREEQKKEAQV